MNFVYLKQFLGIEMSSEVLRNALLVTVWKIDSQDLVIVIDLKYRSLQLIRFSGSARFIMFWFSLRSRRDC